MISLKKQFKNYIRGYDAADIKRANIFSIRNEMNSEEKEQFRPVPDYTSLINYLKESCLKYNGIIKTNEPVKRISKNANIKVITSASKYFCKKIIIAVPLGALQTKKK